MANNKCDKINSNDVNIIHLLLYPTLSTIIPINGETNTNFILESIPGVR